MESKAGSKFCFIVRLINNRFASGRLAFMPLALITSTWRPGYPSRRGRWAATFRGLAINITETGRLETATRWLRGFAVIITADA
jgi:hypothetical protein